jgi:hypothetical protein
MLSPFIVFNRRRLRAEPRNERVEAYFFRNGEISVANASSAGGIAKTKSQQTVLIINGQGRHLCARQYPYFDE